MPQVNKQFDSKVGMFAFLNTSSSIDHDRNAIIFINFQELLLVAEMLKLDFDQQYKFEQYCLW